MKQILLIIQLFIIQFVFCQKLLNGSFENNTANADQINLSNSALNAMLPYVTAFGSYGDVDIIKSGIYGGGGAQDKTWYIALTGGGTDIVSLKLSSPLIKGKKYGLSFYDRKDPNHQVFPIKIGLSNNQTAFGTVVFTSDQTPINSLWSKRSFTFEAPNNGEYITVQMSAGTISDWVNIDNFVLSDTIKNQTNLVQILEPKKDSVTVKIIEPEKNTDTLEFNPVERVKFNRHRFKGRKIQICETILVDESKIKIMLWDKNRMDGDLVSIYLNGKLIEENLEVSKIKKEINIQLQTGSNLIVMHAINLGRIPPNTATIGTDKTKRKFTTLISDLKKSGAFEIIYNPDGLAMK